MLRKYSIIPTYDDLSASVALANEYDATFEYNDFFCCSVYQDKGEVAKRIETYKALDRDSQYDTLHGVFFDIAMTSADDVIRQRSRDLMKMSCETAMNLSCKGVVFHSGLLGDVFLEQYVAPWADEVTRFIPTLCESYPDIEIYLENTFERNPDILVRVAENIDIKYKFKLCLDYAHALLMPTPIDEYVDKMAPYVGHMHVNDHDMHADLHLVPGTGKIDFAKFKEIMNKYDFNQNINILLELGGVERQRQALEFMKNL